jgi:hypothetical protein
MKTTKIIFWVSTGIILLWEGLMPLSTLLFAPQYMNAGTKPLGYPDYFAVTLIIFKFLGALAISLPAIPRRLKEWAYAGLTFNLVFAVISHAVVDKNPGFILLPVIVMILLGLSYFTKDKIRSTQGKQEQSDALRLSGIASA